jgi:hypothetical protein
MDVSGSAPRPEPLDVLARLRAARFPDAPFVALAGSVARGEATASSDLDVLVVHARVEHAFRESFFAEGWPVELFVHDPETLHHFMIEVDRPTGVVPLAHMLLDGTEVTASGGFGDALRALAREVLAAGPSRLDAAQLATRRYAISDLVDDLRAPRGAPERSAIGATLYTMLADFTLRAGGRWSARGKHIPRTLAAVDAALGARYVAAFDALFAHGDVAPVVDLTAELLAPYGGALFDGHRLDAPASWRKPRP